MKWSELISTVAKKEGKKHQATVGDTREIITVLVEEVLTNPEARAIFLKRIKAQDKAESLKPNKQD